MTRNRSICPPSRPKPPAVGDPVEPTEAPQSQWCQLDWQTNQMRNAEMWGNISVQTLSASIDMPTPIRNTGTGAAVATRRVKSKCVKTWCVQRQWVSIWRYVLSRSIHCMWVLCRKFNSSLYCIYGWKVALVSGVVVVEWNVKIVLFRLLSTCCNQVNTLSI
jgi:hypothetical protein